MESPFKETMVDLAGEDHEAALLKWRTILRHTAREAFREATGKLAPSPQHLRAIAKAESELEHSLTFALKIS